MSWASLRAISGFSRGVLISKGWRGGIVGMTGMGVVEVFSPSSDLGVLDNLGELERDSCFLLGDTLVRFVGEGVRLGEVGRLGAQTICSGLPVRDFSGTCFWWSSSPRSMTSSLISGLFLMLRSRGADGSRGDGSDVWTAAEVVEVMAWDMG